MTPPQPGRRGAVGSNGPQKSVPHPDCLPVLRDCQARLSDLLKEIDVRPDLLDSQADNVHEELVIGVYELMRTEVARVCGQRWDRRNRQRFGDRYHAVANKWPTYKVALAELKRARRQGGSLVEPMERLEGPRSGYIWALSCFYDEFSTTLRFFFPP